MSDTTTNEKPHICGAKRGDGTTCQEPPLLYATYCEAHGGAAQRARRIRQALIRRGPK